MENLMKTVAPRGDFELSSGFGSYLNSTDGRIYLDFFTDTGTSSLGYGCSEHREALRRIIDCKLPPHAPNLFSHVLRNRVAEKLCDATGFDRVFFCNSGTESVEAAIKLARKYQFDNGHNGKCNIFSINGAFHGRTYGSMAASDGPLYHFAGFGPRPAGFERFNNPGDIDYESAAAVIIAPVYGANDVIVYKDDFLKELRTRCDNTGTLLIFDEVQSGSGRSGAITYAQKIGVKPDILTLAKGIGMGAPCGATLAIENVARVFTPGCHFSTFGGNPLTMAYVDVMLDWLSDSCNLLEIEAKGEYIEMHLRSFGWAKSIRRAGLMIAVDIEKDARKFSELCLEEGLLLGAFRPSPLKITPPLNITMMAIDEGLEIMQRVYQTM